MGPGDYLDVKKSRGIERFMAGIFILIMTAAFYATAEYKGGLPVLPVGIRYAADVLVMGMGALWIMVTVDMPKIRFLYSISVVMNKYLFSVKNFPSAKPKKVIEFPYLSYKSPK